jgi:single-stranded-DNA-specific exonuclease
MSTREWRWEARHIETRGELARALGVTPTLAGLLMARGYTTAEAAHAFLHPTLDHLHDPLLLPDAEAAATRLARALQEREKILIHGDYDVDGVTATALLTRVLETLGGQVETFVPHRQHDGYDLQVETVRRAAAEGTRLIVTVDCGILAFEAAEAARELGVDLIITDHHQPDPSRLPPAVAVVNPTRLDSAYPFRDLTGVGVAYKVALALLQSLEVPDASFRRNFLDLVALGTVSDCLPLLGENRVLVKFGVEALRTSRKPGIKALLAAAKVPCPTAGSIAYNLGPRLNAIGRLDAAHHAMRLLVTQDPSEAAELAERLNRCNEERQAAQSRVLADAMEQARELDLRRTPVLVLAASGWHAGIIGIVAAKLAESFHRPAILIALEGETGRGSARSVADFHILDALRRCQDHLGKLGGHAGAAGFEIRAQAVPALREALARVAAESLPAEPRTPPLELDDLLAPEEITPQLARELGLLEPFGHGNPEPLFHSRRIPVCRVQRLSPRQPGTADHLKLQLQLTTNGGSSPSSSAPLRLIEALFWRQGQRSVEIRENAEVDLCYTLELDPYWGAESARLIVKDLRL